MASPPFTCSCPGPTRPGYSADGLQLASVAGRGEAGAVADILTPVGTDPTTSPASAQPSSDADTQQIAKLKAIDAEVRAHEAAHLAAAGNLASSGASFQYVKGPDGRLYAVGGEVQITTSSGNTPEETISRAQQVRAAALAPANPSPQDKAVDSRAAAVESQARQELTTRNIARFQAHASPAGGHTVRTEPPAQDPFNALA